MIREPAVNAEIEGLWLTSRFSSPFLSQSLELSVDLLRYAPWLLTSAICGTHDELTEKLGLTTLFLCIETSERQGRSICGIEEVRKACVHPKLKTSA